MIGAIAAHTRGTIETFEILNEPDNHQAYSGTAKDYATTLAYAYRAIRRANPLAKVLMGGLMGTYSMPWLREVLATPGLHAARKFDIANVHIRGTLASVARQVESWKRFFAGAGIDRPLWVTEHGYPSDPAYQRDPRYRSGEPSQARYLRASTRVMTDGGAAKVFVTLRDNLDGEYASEGIVGGTVFDPVPERPQIRRKPSFDAFRAVAMQAAALSSRS
jgi:hypothetical protein